MSEEVEGLFSTISFVVDDKGFNKLEKNLDKIEAKFKDIGNASKELTSSFKTIKLPRISLGGGAGGFSGDAFSNLFKTAGSSVKSFTTSIGEMFKTIPMAGEFMSGLLKGVGTAALGYVGLTIALKKYTSSQLKMMTNADLTAKMLGVEQKDLLNLEKAYSTLGFSADSYINTLKNMQSVQAGLALGQAPELQMLALSQGGVQGGVSALVSGDTEGLTKAIGVRLRDFAEKKKSSPTGKLNIQDRRAFDLIATVFSNIVAENIKRDKFLEVLGIPVTETQKDLTERQLAGTSVKEFEKTAAEFNLEFNKVTSSFSGMALSLTEKILPAFTSVTRWFTSDDGFGKVEIATDNLAAAFDALTSKIVGGSTAVVPEDLTDLSWFQKAMKIFSFNLPDSPEDKEKNTISSDLVPAAEAAPAPLSKGNKSDFLLQMQENAPANNNPPVTNNPSVINNNMTVNVNGANMNTEELVARMGKVQEEANTKAYAAGGFTNGN